MIIKPKLVLAKNKDEFQAFLNKYQCSEQDYIFIGSSEQDLMLMAKMVNDVYGIVLTGNYKKNPIYPTIEMLLNNKRFAIVQIMPIQ